MSRVSRLAILKFVVLTISAPFRTVRIVVVPGYSTARIRDETDCIGVFGLLDSRFWTLALSVGIFRLMEEYDVDSVLDLLALSRGNEIEFGVVDEPS